MRLLLSMLTGREYRNYRRLPLLTESKVIQSCVNRTRFSLAQKLSLTLENCINIGIQIRPGPSRPHRFVFMVRVTFIIRPKAQNYKGIHESILPFQSVLQITEHTEIGDNRNSSFVELTKCQHHHCISNDIKIKAIQIFLIKPKH